MSRLPCRRSFLVALTSLVAACGVPPALALATRRIPSGCEVLDGYAALREEVLSLDLSTREVVSVLLEVCEDVRVRVWSRHHAGNLALFVEDHVVGREDREILQVKLFSGIVYSRRMESVLVYHQSSLTWHLMELVSRKGTRPGPSDTVGDAWWASTKAEFHGWPASPRA